MNFVDTQVKYRRMALFYKIATILVMYAPGLEINAHKLAKC